MPASPRLAILTPDPEDARYRARWRPLFEGYARALAAEGASVRPHPWTAEAPDDVDGCVALLARGYHFQPARWAVRLAEWPPGLRLLNAPRLLSWNSDKRYLAELERAGAPVVPTVFLPTPDAEGLAAAADALGGGELVLKPQVSAGAHGTVRLRAEPHAWVEIAAGLDPSAAVMLQPFLPAIMEEGEVSVLVFGGAPAYAVRKRPAENDFRVQVQWGGAYTTIELSDELRGAAQVVLAALPEPAAYARIDLVRDGEGRLRLMELELIEPDLYLPLAPDGGAAFARSVTAALG